MSVEKLTLPKIPTAKGSKLTLSQLEGFLNKSKNFAAPLGVLKITRRRNVLVPLKSDLEIFNSVLLSCNRLERICMPVSNALAYYVTVQIPIANRLAELTQKQNKLN